MGTLTHNSECWRTHHACAVAKIERLQKEIATRKQFMRWVYDSEASPSEWEWLLQELEASQTENELLQDKIERLRAEIKRTIAASVEYHDGPYESVAEMSTALLRKRVDDAEAAGGE